MAYSLPFQIPFGGEIVSLVPVILIVVGILTTLYAIVRYKTPNTTTPMENVLAVVTFIIGLLIPIAAGLCILYGVYGLLTIILLIILSMALVWGPLSRVMKKIPTLALVAGVSLALACIVVVLVMTFVPIPPVIEAYIGPYVKWIVVALFIIIAVFAFALIVFAKGLIQLFGSILGAWPVMIIIGIVCIIQGVLLIAGLSLSMIETIAVPWHF